MLKRRGNFPYDFDAAYPAYPTPVMPQDRFPHSTPPPVAPVEPTPVAPAEPAQRASSAPIPTPAEGSAPAPPRKRRNHPLKQFSAQRNSLVPPAPDEPEPPHHSRKCTICNHPQREAIDDDFVNWINLIEISIEFDVSERTIRCHARATGLYERRRAKYHAALDLIIESAGRVVSTGDTIIRAIRAASCLDDSGRWVEPPKRVIFTTEHAYAPALSPHSPIPTLAPAKENPVLELSPSVPNEGVLIGPGDD